MPDCGFLFDIVVVGCGDASQVVVASRRWMASR